MSPRRFYNLRPMIGRRFGATDCLRYLTTYATTSAQFTVDITPEGRKPEQQSDGSVKWDLPSNQIESGSAAMEVSTREFLDDYLSLAQRSSIPAATPGATRCIWPTASDSHFTTRPI
jgi:hypothetical protein